MQCGLLGRKLGHSYSPQIHSMLGDYTYLLFEKEPEDLEAFLKSGSFSGLNVTIPHKKAVIPYCDELSTIARQLGAVNTIVRKPDGTLVGHNTDYSGFKAMLQKSGLNVTGKKVLVLGSGGASATVVAVLTESGANAIVISRSGENNYTNLGKHNDASVIVNATPVGMYPETDASPVNIDLFPKLEGVLDLIYNPNRTRILQAAEERGLVAENGLWMLVAQAKESAQWFTGKDIPDSAIQKIHDTLRLQMKNIVLIGMPGCGKSTIGKLLSTRLSKPFVDADTEIEKAAGMPIPEIFQKSGEPGFRKIETEVLRELGKRSGQIIATGGGCVAIPDNYLLLHQNGVILWLQRDITSLPTDGRPLSVKNRLYEMFKIRRPLYEHFSDITINNDSDVNETVEQIICKLKKGDWK